MQVILVLPFLRILLQPLCTSKPVTVELLERTVTVFVTTTQKKKEGRVHSKDFFLTEKKEFL